MKITKYEHACFTVEIDGKLVVVDPGAFTKTLGEPKNVIAVVVTHDHMDHFDEKQLSAIIEYNPDAIVFATEAIVSKLDGSFHSRIVKAGELVELAPFSLEFFGGTHAAIHETMPQIDNVGVLINEKVYYPGDSFDTPEKPVDLLALPVSGPWMKLGEALDFLLAVRPRKVFPTHGSINSDMGAQMVNSMSDPLAKQAGIAFVPLEPGESIEL